MKNTPSEFTDIRLPRSVQLRRIRHVIEHELTDFQRDVLMAVVYGGRTQAEVAQERGVNRSTVCRTLQRAQSRLQRFLRY